MRLKIIALICLLTIAVPVEADAPVITPIPGDTADVEAWLEYFQALGAKACVEPVAVSPDYEMAAEITRFVLEAPFQAAAFSESTLVVDTVDNSMGPSGREFKIYWNPNTGFDPCLF